MIIKLTEIKHKEKILQAAKERQQITFRGKPIRLTADLSAETLQTRTLQARREWQDLFKVQKKKKYTTKITLPRKYFIQSFWRNQKFHRQAKVKKFSTTEPALQQTQEK